MKNKKTLTLCIFLFVTTCAISQDKYVLASLPMGRNGQGITNLGIFHKNVISSSKEIVYIDTVLINNYFRLLSKQVDPKKAILIVEDPVNLYNENIIFATTKPNTWFTAEMISLGFTKWVAADTRPHLDGDSSSYFSAKVYLHKIADRYFNITQIKDSLDFFGFPTLSFTLRDSISKAVVDSVLKCILFVTQDILFELNLKKISSIFKSNGYIPVIVAGSMHVLSLGEPCIVQAYNFGPQTINSIYADLKTINAEKFLIKYFIQKYNIVLKPVLKPK